MWCHDIGREQAANKPLLKTVFQVMTRLFSPRKTTLLFVIRDKTKTPLQHLEPILREDIQTVEVTALSSYEVKEGQFNQEVGSHLIPLDKKGYNMKITRTKACGSTQASMNMPKLTNLSTLKVKINKQKKEAFQILRPELDADTESNPHFDVSMGVNKTKLMRPKRMTFQFVDEGKWSKQPKLGE